MIIWPVIFKITLTYQSQYAIPRWSDPDHYSTNTESTDHTFMSVDYYDTSYLLSKGYLKYFFTSTDPCFLCYCFLQKVTVRPLATSFWYAGRGTRNNCTYWLIETRTKVLTYQNVLIKYSSKKYSVSYSLTSNLRESIT